MYKYISCFILFMFLLNGVNAQTHELDSMRKVLSKPKDDTVRARTLAHMSFAYYTINPDSTIALGIRAADLALSLSFYTLATEAYSNVGIGYTIKGDFPTSLDYYFKALKLDEKINNKEGMASDYGNIGIVYHTEKDYPNAIEYYNKTLEFATETKSEGQQLSALGNLGIIYQDQQQFAKAMEYYNKILAICKDGKGEQIAANTYGNIGIINLMKGDYAEALKNYQMALTMFQKMDDKEGLAVAFGGIGEVYTHTGKFSEAEVDLKKAISLDSSLGDRSELKEKEQALAELYDTTGRYKLAYEWFGKAVALKDSLYNEEKDKALTRKEVTYQYEKKEAQLKAEQDKKDLIAAEGKKKQLLIIYAVSAVLLLVLLLAAFILRGYRQKQKANLLLEEQKRKIDNAYGELHEKHKEITDSINYAKRIQSALFKEEEYVTKHLPEHFIYFKPRNVVSGDFYWGYEREGYWYIAAVDCTGHGVPGAFLTMLGSAFLNEICSAKELLTAAEVLNRLRDKVIKELGAQGEVKDGMDISLCRIQIQTKEIHWAGANNPLWYVQAGAIKELTADKQPIGYQDGQKPFTNHIINLGKNDMLYLFTDGYADQFGGPRGKKFKYKQLQEKLAEITALAPQQQKTALGSTFEAWKGSLEQTDDVLIVGIRI